MNSQDLNDYIKANSKAYDIYIEKELAHQRVKNAGRKLKSRFSDSKMDAAAEKEWENIINKLHEKLSMEDTLKKKNAGKWISFIQQNDLLESFEESMSDLDLEAE